MTRAEKAPNADPLSQHGVIKQKARDMDPSLMNRHGDRTTLTRIWAHRINLKDPVISAEIPSPRRALLAPHFQFFLTAASAQLLNRRLPYYLLQCLRS